MCGFGRTLTKPPDGEWQHTIVDDKLYTRAPDYDEAQDERVVWDDINRVDSAEEYRKAHLTGSRALYFAQCSEDNETWLPLLEKAYAKAHGDFASIDGGFTGEAIEDLTGGVTTEIYSTDILNRENFWREELLKVGNDFLFGCATGFYANWLDTSGVPREREGISEGHAYSIMDAKEINGQRLLKLRNPWGKKEWTGRWSDGSSEWTPEWMQLLDHKFGNDGIFWISYEDLLKKYQHFDRTRIFGPEWNVTQCWTSMNVSWSAEYHSTRFSLTLAEKTRVVIVLAQLDDTYFGGLEGGYGFDLQFRLESDQKEDDNDYIVRSNGNYAMARSVSTDIELEAGTYSVLMRVTATRHTDREHVEDVLPVFTATRREKLIQMGLSYDLAHAKGAQVETEAERKERKARVKERRTRGRQKMKNQAKTQAQKDWKREKKNHELQRKRAARKNHWRQRKCRANEDSDDDIVDLNQILGIPHAPDSVSPEAPGEIKKQGEIIVNGTSNEKADVAADGLPQADNKPEEENPAEKLVEPLADVIKVADIETQTNAAESTSNREVTEAQNSTTEIIDSSREGGQSALDGAVDGSATIKDLKPLSSAPPRSSPEHIANGVSASTNRAGKLHQKESNGRAARYERPQRSDTLDSTAAMIGLGSGTNSSPGPEDIRGTQQQNGLQQDAEGPQADGAEQASDADSFPPFDWDTELDFSGANDSDSDSNSASSIVSRRFYPRYRPPYLRRGGRRRRSRSPPMGPIPPPVPREYIDIVDKGPPGEIDDDGPEETWNAVCVAGLRVYSTLKGEGVKLKVVKPSGFTDDEDEIGNRKKNSEGTGTGGEAKLDPDDPSKGAVAVEPESTGAIVEGEGEKMLVEKVEELKLGRSARGISNGHRPGTGTAGRRMKRGIQIARR